MYSDCQLTLSHSIAKMQFHRNCRTQTVYLTIVPRARMGSESIAHSVFGLMGY